MSDLIERLKKRAEIRRNIKTRKSVQENKPDRISDLLEESAKYIENLQEEYEKLKTDSIHYNWLFTQGGTGGNTAIEKQKQKEYQDMMVCKKCNINRGKEADCFYPHACPFTGVAHND